MKWGDCYLGPAISGMKPEKLPSMKSPIILLLAFLAFGMHAQTPPNFHTPDCTGVEHDLYQHLADGEVIVLCWVMPCVTCIGPALTTYNVVQSYQPAWPNTVKMFLCDDFANTKCSILNNWADDYQLTESTRFSSSAIKMIDYGSFGMPKIVVLGGGEEPTVFYNANNAVDPNELIAAIDEALLQSGTAFNDPSGPQLIVFPNPSTTSTTVQTNLEKPTTCTITLFRMDGTVVHEWPEASFPAGHYTFTLPLVDINQGSYLMRVDSPEWVVTRLLTVLP